MIAELWRLYGRAAQRFYNRLVAGLRGPEMAPEPLRVTQRYRRRTIDHLGLPFIEINGIRDALAGAEVKLTGTVLFTDWAVVEKAPSVPFREDLLFDPDDTLELTIVLERRA